MHVLLYYKSAADKLIQYVNIKATHTTTKHQPFNAQASKIKHWENISYFY